MWRKSTPLLTAVVGPFASTLVARAAPGREGEVFGQERLSLQRKSMFGRTTIFEHRLDTRQSLSSSLLGAQPGSELESLVKRASVSGEFSPEFLKGLLDQCCAMGRFDRAMALARLFEKTGTEGGKRLVLRADLQPALDNESEASEGALVPALEGEKIQPPWKSHDTSAISRTSDRRLNAMHYSMLMQCANETERWKATGQLWDEMLRRGIKLNFNCYGLYAEALKHQQKWAEALALFEQAISERMPMSHLLVASTMAALRSHHQVTYRNGRQEQSSHKAMLEPPSWQQALRVFSTATEKGKLTGGQRYVPSSSVYHELLCYIEELGVSKTSRWADTWATNLALVESTRDHANYKVDTFNVLLRSLARGRQYEVAAKVFKSMQQPDPGSESVGGASSVDPVLPDVDTYLALAQLQGPKPTSGFCLELLHQMSRQNVSANSDFYELLFQGYHISGQSKHGLDFFRQALDRSAVGGHLHLGKGTATDTAASIPVSTIKTEAVLLGFIDSLLAHESPATASLLLTEAKQNHKALESIIPTATAGLAALGTKSQQWVVEGRVAVVDHEVLSSKGALLDLVNSYDSIFVPFSALRYLVRGKSNFLTGKRPPMPTKSLNGIRHFFTPDSHLPDCLRIIPLTDQLQAHAHLLGTPMADLEGLAALEAFSEQRLLEAAEESQAATIQIRHSYLPSSSGGTGKTRTTSRSTKTNALASLRNSGNKEGGSSLTDQALHHLPAPKVEVTFTNPHMQHISVARMLKRLNPDAQVEYLVHSETSPLIKAASMAAQIPVTICPRDAVVFAVHEQRRRSLAIPTHSSNPAPPGPLMKPLPTSTSMDQAAFSFPS